jgi:general secretion pathway protein K
MRRQSGVALITVLLVVAIVTVVCAGLIARQQVSIRNSANQMLQRQAWQYALGGEALGESLLLRDLRAKGADPQNPVDHPLEDWAKPLPVFPVDNGEIAVRIEDLAGRFNLNSLVQDGHPDRQAVERFKRLLERLQIDQPYAERLVDWLDADQEPTGEHGAEDNQYLLALPPFRSAGREMRDASELRLLQGMTEAYYRVLTPYVVALPAKTPLNVNTASALVLSCLSDRLDPGSAQALVNGRGREGYRDVRAFLDQQALAGSGVRASGLAVGSRFFRVTSEVRLAERRLLLTSVLFRDAKQVRVLHRDQSPPALLPPAPATSKETL